MYNVATSPARSVGQGRYGVASPLENPPYDISTPTNPSTSKGASLMSPDRLAELTHLLPGPLICPLLQACCRQQPSQQAVSSACQAACCVSACQPHPASRREAGSRTPGERAQGCLLNGCCAAAEHSTAQHTVFALESSTGWRTCLSFL